MYCLPESLSDVTTVATLALVAAVWSSTASASVPDPNTGLPSCTVLPAESPNVAPVYIEVDGQGRTYSTQFGDNPLAPLASWRAYPPSEAYESLCASGLSIAFWGADGFPTRPGRYIDIVEFVNASSTPRNYFLSAKEEESSFIRAGKAGKGWQVTPLRMRVPRSGPDLVPVHRFLGADEPGTITHFFTADPIEIAAWQAKAQAPATATRWWTYEGIAFYAPKVSELNGVATCSNATDRPVFRVSGVGQGKTQPKFRYVGNVSTIASMKKVGYVVDVAAFCALID